jgi:hypothetical protein
VLWDGRRGLLLDDRGWGASGPPDIWAVTSVEEIVDTARTVVGPDEPFEEGSHEDWRQTTGPTWPRSSGSRGIAADALELPRLPHDVASVSGCSQPNHHPGDADQR